MLDTTKAKIEALKNDPSVTAIDFHNEVLGEEGAKLLTEAIVGRQIVSLNLSGCDIPLASMELFKPFLDSGSNAALRTLNLVKQPFDFTLLNNTRCLTSLSLEIVGINQIHINQLASVVHKNLNLKNIDLSNSVLAGLMLQPLAVTNLENLILTHCQLTLDQVKVLFSMKTLKSFVVGQNNFTDDEFKASHAQWLIEQTKKQFLGAVDRSDKKSITNMLAKDKSLINTASDNMGTALHHAKSVSMVNFLLKKGADINSPNKQELTALEYNITHNSPDFLFLVTLLNAEINAGYQPSDYTDIAKLASSHGQPVLAQFAEKAGQNAALDAALNAQTQALNDFKLQVAQELKTLRETIDAQAKRIKTGQDFFNELLISGAVQGNTALIETAINGGANLDAVNEVGETPLFLSIKAGHFDTASNLLNKKPELLSGTNKSGKTPLEELAAHDNYDEAEWLLTQAKALTKEPTYKGEKLDPLVKKAYDVAGLETKKLFATDKLWVCVKIGKLDGIKEVLDQNELGIDINAIRHKRDNETLLYQAVYYKHADIVSYLLSKGADLNVASHIKENSNDDKRKGETAYEVALIKEDKLLMKIMASHLLLDASKRTDVEGISKAINDATKVLGDAKVILTQKNADGQTALHLLALGKDDSCMSVLLSAFDNDASILEAKDNQGKTALHLAVEQKNASLVQLLLNKKASLMAADTLGQIPLHKAMISQDMGIIDLLLREHAKCSENIHVKDHQDKTPIKIMYAINEEVATELLTAFGSYKAEYKHVKDSQAFASVSSTNQTFFNQVNRSSVATTADVHPEATTTPSVLPSGNM